MSRFSWNIMSTNLLEAVAKLFKCQVIALHEYLNHPLAENKLNDFLKEKKLRTCYLNKNLERKEVKYGAISLRSSDQQPAYEGYLSVTVQQHFYCRHRIRLMYPRLRCVVEYGKGGHNKYYPLELLEIVNGEEDISSAKDEDPDNNLDRIQRKFTPWFLTPSPF